MTRTKDSDDLTIMDHPFEGLKNGEARLAKAKIARQINTLLKQRGLTQKQAAKRLCITQPEVSMLANGRLSGFTFDRLYRCLQMLGVDIEIRLKSHSSPAAAGCLQVVG